MWLLIVFLYLEVHIMQVEIIFFFCYYFPLPKQYLAHSSCLINKQMNALFTFYREWVRNRGLKRCDQQGMSKNWQIRSGSQVWILSLKTFSGPLPRPCANLINTIDFSALISRRMWDLELFFAISWVLSEAANKIKAIYIYWYWIGW